MEILTRLMVQQSNQNAVVKRFEPFETRSSQVVLLLNSEHSYA